MMSIGFLVRSLNEEQWIGHCLQSIINFEIKNKISAKIVVVDNESSDDTLKIVKMFKEKVDVFKAVGIIFIFFGIVSLNYGKLKKD